MAETNFTLKPNYDELEIPAHATPEGAMHHKESDASPKSHKWTTLLVVILVVVILLGFGIFFAYRYLFAQSQDPNSLIGAAWVDIHTKADSDPDQDGLSDEQEAKYGSNFWEKDTDHDGFTDGEEVLHGYNPSGAGKLSDSKLNLDNIGI